MCLIIFAHRPSSEFPLLIAANRDEFHARPTAASGFWADQPGLLAGRDLEQGGTWMGITRSGRFAAVTNYRDPARTAPAPRSRGELTTGFLTGSLSPQAYLEGVAVNAGEYAGFNLLLGDREGLWYFSNSCPQPRQLEPGIYGLSNARLDTAWPKVERGKKALAAAPDDRLDHDLLARAVSDRQLASVEELGRHGLDGEMDQLLSAQCIVNRQYGTRSTTTLWLGSEGSAHWRELSFAPDGSETGRVELEFGLE
jgi:uncharacterized protein with NRDE domain